MTEFEKCLKTTQLHVLSKNTFWKFFGILIKLLEISALNSNLDQKRLKIGPISLVIVISKSICVLKIFNKFLAFYTRSLICSYTFYLIKNTGPIILKAGRNFAVIFPVGRQGSHRVCEKERAMPK